MQVLEQRVPVRALQLVDRLDRGLGLARAMARPGGEEGCCEISDRPAHRLREVLLRRLIFLLLERLHADDQAGDPVVAVNRGDLLGKPRRFLDVAFRQHREEGALQEFVVLRIVTQRCAIVGRGGPGIPLRAGVARGEIAAGHRQPRKLVRRGYEGLALRRVLRGALRGQRCGQTQCRRANQNPGQTANLLRKVHGQMPPWAAIRQPSESPAEWTFYKPPARIRGTARLSRCLYWCFFCRTLPLDVAAS